jgi:transglutaminase-like putative cysteine protease
MSPKAHAKKRRKQTSKWVIIGAVAILSVMLLAVACFWKPAEAPSDSVSSPSVEPAGLKALTDHYLAVMHSLNSSQTKTAMAQRIDAAYNQTQLFGWEQSRLSFAQDPSGWFEDPIKILDSGKGICVQHSIVYVSACLARGYQSRLVVAVDTSSWSFIHTWAEDYYNGSWVHVDPSDGVWNIPAMYQNWDWGKGIGSTVRIFAFTDDSFEDVTGVYGVT